jgi:hypothetical protein
MSESTLGRRRRRSVDVDVDVDVEIGVFGPEGSR